MITPAMRAAIRVEQAIAEREHIEAVGPAEYELRNGMQSQHNADDQAAEVALASAEAYPVTDEMVEVACRAEWAAQDKLAPAGYKMTWDEVPEEGQDFWRTGVRAGLEAVAAMGPRP